MFALLRVRPPACSPWLNLMALVYTRITDISEDGNFLPDKKVSVNQINSQDYLLENGDVVLARTGASTGKSYLYKPDDGELVICY